MPGHKREARVANVGKADLVMELAEKTGLGQKDVETVAKGMCKGV